MDRTREPVVDVTLPMLEDVRRRLRMLVPSIEKAKKNVVYADFEDFIGDGVEVAFDGLNTETFDRFRKKARAFLNEHRDDWAIQKLHMNLPVTGDDLAELQRIVVEAGIGTEADCERASADAGGFGLFIRRLVGLDRNAAKIAFAEFLDGRSPTADQIEFVNLVIDELTANGVIEPRRLFESPFTNVHEQGPDAVFERDAVGRLFEVVADVRHRATAAA